MIWVFFKQMFEKIFYDYLGPRPMYENSKGSIYVIYE